jgi:hypothetical protein
LGFLGRLLLRFEACSEHVGSAALESVPWALCGCSNNPPCAQNLIIGRNGSPHRRRTARHSGKAIAKPVKALIGKQIGVTNSPGSALICQLRISSTFMGNELTTKARELGRRTERGRQTQKLVTEKGR